MPIFEFECLECGATFEKLVKKAVGDEQITCPGCGGQNVEQRISTFASTNKSSCAPSGG